MDYKKVTIKEFQENKIFIMAFTDEQKEIRTRWLKRAGYKHFNKSTAYKINDCICAGGGITDLKTSEFLSGGMRFCTVYQLEGWDEPIVKEMTVEQISKELGYEIKIVK